ncbi:MAG TPA: fumarylacetoacetate hydrolase, partial [Verrucomicrobiae bacterium]|nr:fumarylacetoacetate hydrolase [Verrucomicrobiae bacterium]
MKLCRFQTADDSARVGIWNPDDTITDLSALGIERMEPLVETPGLIAPLAALAGQLPRFPRVDVQLLAPAERQEIWAAGVTYLRSKKARMEESDFSATAYDRVYEAPRPEIFFKSLPEKAVPAGEPVGIRKDSRWNVPEPELALVLDSRGQVAGFTIGNDMSSRDIEGENLL